MIEKVKALHVIQNMTSVSALKKVIFVDLLLPKTKPISVRIVYRPPKYTHFLQLFAEIRNSLNILENEIFVLGDMNIDILQNGVNLL